MKKIDENKIENAFRDIIDALGENINREGLKDTPKRMAQSYGELFSGLLQNPEDVLKRTFEVEKNDLIVEKNIDFHSMCEHHLVPFHGLAHVAYIPSDGCVTGLSKLARAVEVASKRPQLQERLTVQIANALEEALKPKGVLVMIEAEHMCMTMRGIKKSGSKTVTRVARGICQSDKETRQEIIAMIHHN